MKSRGNKTFFFVTFFALLHNFYGVCEETEVKNLPVYIVVKTKATQAKALYDCIHIYNGRLLTIMSQDQDEQIEDIVVAQNLTDTIVTSGKYNYFEKRWEWSTTATVFDYENWSPSSPGQPEYCCFKPATGTYRWTSQSCANEGIYICES